MNIRKISNSSLLKRHKTVAQKFKVFKIESKNSKIFQSSFLTQKIKFNNTINPKGYQSTQQKLSNFLKENNKIIIATNNFSFPKIQSKFNKSFQNNRSFFSSKINSNFFQNNNHSNNFFQKKSIPKELLFQQKRNMDIIEEFGLVRDVDEEDARKKQNVWTKKKSKKKIAAEEAMSIEESIAETSKTKTESYEIAFQHSAPKIKLPPRSPEVLAKEKVIVSKYAQGVKEEEARLLKVANTFIKLKLDAISELPVEMQETAWVPDEESYPKFTWWPTWTVPETFPIRARVSDEGKVEKRKKKIDMSYGVGKKSRIIK